MASIFSPNRLYTLLSTGSSNGTWGIVTNATLSVIDLNFGGRLTISVAGSSNITVSTTQARNVYHTLTGVITGNIDYILPAEGMTYLLNNTTTGNFTVTAKCAGGTGIVLPQGATTAVFVNPDTTAATKSFNYCNNVFGGATTGGSGNAQTITVDSGFALTAGNIVTCKLGFSNSGAMTLAVNSGTAKSVTDTKTNALASGAAVSGQMAIFAYDGTQYQLLNPAVIPVTGGGTGLATLTAHAVITGNGTSTPNFIAPSTSGNVLVSNGTDWTSASIVATVGAALFPVGSIYTNYSDSTNPATLLGFGTWTAMQDSFLIGAGNLYAAGATGGATTHTLTVGEIPALTYNGTFGNTGGSFSPPFVIGKGDAAGSPVAQDFTLTTNAGGGSHSILNPYIAVYMWRRTA